MDKEREIEEMAKTVNNGCRVACSDCRERALCEVRHVAEVLVDEGYRKADEARKETAKEILQTIWDRFSRKISDEFGDMASDIKYITLDVEEVYDYLLGDLAGEYGIEVDE